MSDLLLGIDAGLTTIKAVLFDLTGRALATGRAATPLTASAGGRSEIDMAGQWAATCRVVRDAIERAGIRLGQVAAVGLSGHGNGMYLLDGEGAALGPAVSSMDHRAQALLSELPPGARARLRELTLQTLWSGQPGLILRWLREHEPGRYNRARRLLFCKDWLRRCLTGEEASDYTDVSASGLYAVRARAYDAEIFDQLGIPEAGRWLTEVRPSWAVTGTVQASAGEQTGLAAGTPVVAGLFDVTANALGSGLVDEGCFCTVGGTWSLNIGLSRQPRIPEAIRQCTIYADERYYSYIDSSATSAANLEWLLRRVLGEDVTYGDFERALSGVATAAGQPLFLPFVCGGLRDDDPGGSFLGLRSAHGRDDILAAVGEGIVFAHRFHIESLGLEGLTGDCALFTGGASRSYGLCQLLADCLHMPVVTLAAEETGALGAAIAAAVGAGAYPSMAQAAGEMVHTQRAYQPDPRRGDVSDRRYAAFRSAMTWLAQSS